MRRNKDILAILEADTPSINLFERKTDVFVSWYIKASPLNCGKLLFLLDFWDLRFGLVIDNLKIYKSRNVI